ncbi:hypothetical protein CTAYLR_003384 [Chrysophaeum taylorii]|uniref:RING-type domain-containing protein n=1 Tax=Chrysophaeum taylorii TaxID=2483200 RepID=A0AAD7UEN4_9STRA|nr:hypothetical protein CTAYLR_003384 [Chrysophaeum taylorii]
MGAGASADQGHILIASNGTGDLILINGPIAGAAFAGLVDPRAGFSAALADQGRVGPPPTSQAALAKLPVVRVSADDLAQDENAACCVCLEKHSVGDPVLRLPCGHLYHEACAMSWLKEHCTCPNCRYELPTDDADYEAGRKARMRHRRPRYRLGELMDLSVHHLRDLLRDAEVDASRLRGVCEKRDLVRCVIDTKAVDLVADPLPLALDVDVMRNEWSVKQLHDLAARVGVDVAGLDSTEMIDVLLDSGKIIPA